MFKGLNSREAAARLERYGPNRVAEAKQHRFLGFMSKFWGPVPWMLEVTIILEVVLAKYPEAVIISVLLLFNSAVSFFQEGRAQDALELLKSRLRVTARVLRDGNWQLVPAEELVPGDAIHIRMGDLVPADLTLSQGEVELNQAALTGESLPVGRRAGESANAGAFVARGEASGTVTATGSRTYFGRTAQLVSSARTVSHIESIIFSVVKYLVLLDLVLVAALLVYAIVLARTLLPDILPFSLILIVASVPVALPATFTLATALGAIELVGRGVLVTRLSAIEEAAAMEVLCVDKTGTITENRLHVARAVAYPPNSEDDVLRLAAMASEEATQDPIDMAVIASAKQPGLSDAPPRLEFLPFDPARKYSQAVFSQDGARLRVMKGAATAIGALMEKPDESQLMEADAQRLAAAGYRVLAVASGSEGDGLRPAGLVALEDPPRADSPELIAGLHRLGVRVAMVTGDALATARAVAARVGIAGEACSLDELRQPGSATRCSVFGGVFPEDKFHLVQRMQAHGLVTGMTGDGVNDAPALRQAEAGIAVSTATDVAKAAASMVLTAPGLKDILAAVESSRRIYQRMLTYTLNKVIKTLEIAVFLSFGVMLTGEFIITPLLIVLLIFTNDFVTMTIATDRVSFSRSPDRWNIRSLFLICLLMAAFILVLSFSVFFTARGRLGLSLEQVQTLVFVMLVFTGQGTLYLVRERGHFWQSRPSRWLAISSVLDIVVVSSLAIEGILMTAISASLVAGLLGVIIVYLFLVDFVKVRIFRLFALRQP